MSLQGCGPRVRVASLWLARTLGWAMALLFIFAVVPAVAHAADTRGPEAKDVIEFTRIVQPRNHALDALQAQISSDGAQAFIVTRKADVATDVNRFEVLLLDIAPARLAAIRGEGDGVLPQRLVSIDATEDSDDANPFLQDARWVGNRTIVFRGQMQGQRFQAFAVDVQTRQLTQLTFDPIGVVSFDVSADLKRVVYVAPVPNPPLVPGARTVVVGNQSFWSVKFGQEDFMSQHRRFQYWMAEGGSRKAARPIGVPFPESSGRFPRVSVSPDGRWALLPRYEPERQLAWGVSFPMIARMTDLIGPALTQDPLSYYSRPYSYVVRRLMAWRLDDLKSQAIVDAPDDSLPGSGQLRPDRLWLGGGSVVIGGTFLPQGTAGGSSSASHVIEYWPATGRWKVITVLKDRLVSLRAVAGQSNAFVAIDGNGPRQFVRNAHGEWRELEPAVAAAGETAAGWSLRISEGLDQPPDVVAVGPGGKIVRLTELNPQFSGATWGTIRPYAWKDAKGRPWEGGLMVPNRFDRSVRHPLVIQTYGFTPSRFYLDGSNEYTGFTSGFAGRAFLREGVLVLALPWSASANAPVDERGANAAFAEGVRGAVEALAGEGIVDRDRVGIIGWSATGERVLNMLTFSDAPVRAATILDGDANTLFSLTITYAVKDGIQVRKERTNEGGPYGESLARWVRNDPSMHTDCVKAALRIESYGAPVLNNWDVYALLRRQYKAAEMIVFPGGAHALSRPAERMASLQGNVDWYRFWLKDEERSEVVIPTETEAALKEQYVRWRQMADLKRADDRKPRCASAG